MEAYNSDGDYDAPDDADVEFEFNVEGKSVIQVLIQIIKFSFNS